MLSQITWTLLEKVLLPAAFLAVGGGALSFVFSIPLIGPWLRDKIISTFKLLYDWGVIELKVAALDRLDAKAKEGYEPMIEMLREAQTREFLDEEEEAEFEKRLKEMVRNHPSVVNG